ncbi:hypothetical protein [Prochlorococcus sp. MIT 1341]|uniref:hypothetical protein n=1 Tax=Prochlorococcus sp. MIT 1341 TaxID=3096221 RepID=UPI002A7505BD|nr:hypothetical protein [Prochlorococcus sp. MIT 1341]
MEPESASRSSQSHTSPTIETGNMEMQEDFLSFNSPSIVFLGFIIAIATIAVPLYAVISIRPHAGSSSTTTVIENNGSKLPLPITVLRFGQPGS